jgi:site-specific DNA-adenine methylase
VTLRPFFSFYGSKWRCAKKYPAPEHQTIIEPFAGSAGYSLRYPDHSVWLVDKDPVVAGVWQYLIGATESEILALPVGFDHVDDITVIPEARDLIGFWLNHGTTHPCRTPSSWMRKGQHNSSFWGEVIRHRIASQVQHIRHWRISNMGYEDLLSNPTATWFIDPPYETKAGRRYRFSDIDYERLGAWCRSRQGQVIACDQAGAEWLPFHHLADVKSTLGKSSEMIWLNNQPNTRTSPNCQKVD